jgi:hypothetical protein
MTFHGWRFMGWRFMGDASWRRWLAEASGMGGLGGLTIIGAI